MTRPTMSRLIVGILLLCAAPLFAHEEFRFIGTVTKLENSMLQVKDREGNTYAFRLSAGTYIHRDKEQKKLTMADLKVGTSVVVDALGDDPLTDLFLLGMEVRIVPAIPASKPK